MSHGPDAAAAGGAPMLTRAAAVSAAIAPTDSSALLKRRSRNRTIIETLPFLGHPSVHCWLDWPLQVHSSTRAPLAVLAPVTSRHSPDWTPVIVPLELS